LAKTIRITGRFWLIAKEFKCMLPIGPYRWASDEQFDR